MIVFFMIWLEVFIKISMVFGVILKTLGAFIRITN
jgi:hypothetical protein